jgi:hypothetical protein
MAIKPYYRCQSCHEKILQEIEGAKGIKLRLAFERFLLVQREPVITIAPDLIPQL